MMRALLLAITLYVVESTVSMAEPPLTADVSRYDISIDSNFQGARLLVFGSQNQPGDITSTILGPSKTLTVWRKKRQFGLWLKRDFVTFANTPTYLSQHVATSDDDGISLSPEFWAVIDQRKQTDAGIFKAAALGILQQEGLYRTGDERVQYMGDSLFKHFLILPDSIEEGHYAVQVALDDVGGNALAIQNLPIRIQKYGLEAYVSKMAHEQPILYGIACVLIALMAGFLANLLFRKV